ncbi:hypothetical protein P7H06_20360 [Paenibacillus larvae]|nr:hypothetical protein [Paenibacillus larvae]MDT2261375.1 hypothetical protein [Paenibacillus larvae]
MAEKAIDPNASMEDIQALQGSKSDLKMRFDVIKEQHDALEAEQKAKLKANFEAKDNINSAMIQSNVLLKQKAELIRSAMLNNLYQLMLDKH